MEKLASFLTTNDVIGILASSFAEILRTGAIQTLEQSDIPQLLPINQYISAHGNFEDYYLAYRNLRELLFRITKGRRNTTTLEYTIEDSDPIGSKGILPVRMPPLGIDEAEQWAMYDYYLVLNQPLIVRETTGINGYQDEEYIEYIIVPFPVIVTQTLDFDVMHWNDEFLDPYWNLIPVEGTPYSSLWTFGRSYEVPLDFTGVETLLIRAASQLRVQLVSN